MVSLHCNGLDFVAVRVLTHKHFIMERSSAYFVGSAKMLLSKAYLYLLWVCVCSLLTCACVCLHYLDGLYAGSDDQETLQIACNAKCSFISTTTSGFAHICSDKVNIIKNLIMKKPA